MINSKKLENVTWTYLCPNCQSGGFDDGEQCPICHGARRITVEQLKANVGKEAGVAFTTALKVDHGEDEEGNTYIPYWTVNKAGMRPLIGNDIFHIHVSCSHPYRNEILQVCDAVYISKNENLYRAARTLQDLFGKDWFYEMVGCEAIAVVNKNGFLTNIFVPSAQKSINVSKQKYLKAELLKGESFF